VEQMVAESIQTSQFGSRIVLRPSTAEKIIDELHMLTDRAQKEGEQPVILTSPNIRLHLRRMLCRALPRLAVLSFHEIAGEVEIESVGVISTEVLM
jgi:flagellar biosynthesis protein FlhA